MTNQWSKSERSLYLILCGITAAAVVVWGVGAFIDACRTRPKVQVFAFGMKKPDDKEKEVKQPVESEAGNE